MQAPSSTLPLIDSEKLIHKTDLSSKLKSGAIAGVLGTSIRIFPLDTLKTRLQNQKGNISGLNMFKQIIRMEGARGLYRGLVPNLVGVTPEKAIKLAVNDAAREIIAKRKNLKMEELTTVDGMVAGATAGFCQVIATNPMEMAKIQMQIAGENGAKKSLTTIVKELGLRGLYKGTTQTLCRDVPFSLIFFSLSAYIKQTLHRETGSSQLWHTFASGIMAGSFAAIVVTPMDVVKTRIQIMHHPDRPNIYSGMLNCYQVIYKTEGIKAFFKGSAQRCLIVAPLFGISLLAYELQQKYSMQK
ncbi:putative transmembrane protein [Rozella allomycis CSF55]|uniref:Mitochondrial substrate/solute carrier domain-containing protein n=1 Tax=Rozella allomycis (strain CSF55) TaxID=988480 RepID=A0A075AXP3_ROZAC|nr:Mitochondrial substrate/solute carrier domain-containing protein [Rozella allomycis CSF55]RKP18761.1 putative transmembrane protein [Rozella allomycis CSF55]|eukprot:EPZ33319.1 Mitochondrial substrate/solute carrier domain-containing protein [Rozella allomycis CSF55]